jgi:hypothetical protein
MLYRMPFILLSAAIMFAAAACSDKGTNAPPTAAQNANGAGQQSQSSPAPRSGGSQTPAKNLTPADVAKLKWLVGNYRGSGAEKPFFNRYRLEGTTLKVQGFEDEAMTQQTQAADYELIDGMFANPSGDHRFAATEITDDHVQFVTLTDGTAAYKLEKLDGGKVKATLESTGPDGKPSNTSFTLEPLKK